MKITSIQIYFTKIIFRQKMADIPLRPFSHKTLPGVSYRSIFDRKFFFVKYIWIDVIFIADSEYDICFALTLSYNAEKYQI